MMRAAIALLMLSASVAPAHLVPIDPSTIAASAAIQQLSQAIARRAGVPLSLESLLRAAALGTIADLVPLRGENRTIAALGLRALAGARAPGLRALLGEAGIPDGVSPTSEEIAFRVAPRLNAAGNPSVGWPSASSPAAVMPTLRKDVGLARHRSAVVI